MEEELDLDFSTKSEDWILGWTNYLLRTPLTEVQSFFEGIYGKTDKEFTSLNLIQLLSIFFRIEAVISEFPFLRPNDDRIEYHEFQNPNSLNWKRFGGTLAGISQLPFPKRLEQNVRAGITAIAAVVKKSRYEEYRNEEEKTLQEVIRETFKKDLCDKFVDQPCIARGTAFLIREDLLLTAMHNLYDENGRIKDEDLVYIFDFYYDKDNVRPVIKESNVYYGKALDKNANPFDDWVLIHLDPIPKIHNSRIVKDRAPLKLKKFNNQPWRFKGFYSAGFSLGIPMKLVLVGHYVKRLNGQLFTVNLDLFHGNSGSPILTLTKNHVVGLLISGFPDFEEPVGNCIHLRKYQYLEIGRGHAGERIRWIGMPLVKEINLVLAYYGLGEI